MTASAPTQPAQLARDEGTTDLWWPYGPTVGRYTIKTTAAGSAGALVQLLIRDGRGAATPLHVHHDVDETFFVVSGTLTAWVGDERLDVKAGDFVFGPRGVPHAWVVTSERVEMLVTCGPAGRPGPEGAGIAGFFREVGVPVGDGPPPAPTMPDPEHFARRMQAYGIDLLGPPPERSV